MILKTAPEVAAGVPKPRVIEPATPVVPVTETPCEPTKVESAELAKVACEMSALVTVFVARFSGVALVLS